MSFLFKRNVNYQNLSVTDYHTQFHKGDHVLVDVRTTGEFRQGHLPGALNIPLDELDRRVSEIPNGKPVIVVCASGNRSQAGSQIIASAGHETVYNLRGGTMAWMMQGFQVER